MSWIQQDFKLLKDIRLNFTEDHIKTLKQLDIHKGISVQLDFYSEATRNNKIREAILQSHEATHDKLIELIKQNQGGGAINSGLDPLAAHPRIDRPRPPSDVCDSDSAGGMPIGPEELWLF